MYSLQCKYPGYAQGIELPDLIRFMNEIYFLDGDVKIQVYMTLQQLCLRGLVMKDNCRKRIKYRLIGPVACLMHSPEKSVGRYEESCRVLDIFWGNHRHKSSVFPDIKDQTDPLSSYSDRFSLLLKRRFQKIRFWKNINKDSTESIMSKKTEIIHKHPDTPEVRRDVSAQVILPPRKVSPERYKPEDPRSPGVSRSRIVLRDASPCTDIKNESDTSSEKGSDEN